MPCAGNRPAWSSDVTSWCRRPHSRSYVHQLAPLRAGDKLALQRRASGEVGSADRPDDVPARVNDRDITSRMVAGQLGRMFEFFFGGEEDRALHDVLEFEIASRFDELLTSDQPEEPAFLGDDQLLRVRQSQGVRHPHVRTECGGRLHDLVDPRWCVSDDDRPAGGFGPDAGAGSEELALEPRTAWSADDEERSGR